jgi:predicted S18 family serine protease
VSNANIITNALRKGIKKMAQEIEKLKELSKLYRNMSNTLNKAIKLAEKEENGELDLSEEEVDKKLEEIMEEFITQSIKAQLKIGGLK